MELNEPLILKDLLKSSIFFKIDKEQAIERNDEDLLSNDANDVKECEIESPWLQSFDELRSTMERVGNKYDLHKKIIQSGSGDTLGKLCMMNCRVHWTYSTFMEGEKYAYDSSHNGPSTVRKTESDELMPGIWLALRSMRKGEEAQFVIGHRLMYGTYGHTCGAYHIKPEADILLVAKLVDFNEIGSEDACEHLAPEHLHHYRTLKRRLIEMRTKMLNLYERKVYGNAIKIALDIIERVTFCDASTDTDESHDRKEFLAGIFVTLIDCYARLEKYKKVLAMIEKLRQLTNVERFVGVLVNQAIAMDKMGDNYREPIALMRKAQTLYPDNELVKSTMNDLQTGHRKYMEDKKSFMMKAFEVKPSSSASSKKANTEASPSRPGVQNMMDIVQSFDQIDIGNGIPLLGHTPEEMTMLKAAIEQSPKYRLKTTKTHDGQTNYTIVKAD